jgi:PAS domain S-box-containing protein
MTASHLAETQLVDGIPATRLLEALSRLYRWIVVTDAQRRVLWMSDALAELAGPGELALGCDARSFLLKLPRPEQVFPLRSKLRQRTSLIGMPLELRARDGGVVPVRVSVVKVETAREREPVLIAIARPLDSEEEPPSAPPRAAGVDAQVVDASRAAILAVDAEGFVVRANRAAARLLERPAEELVGCPVALLLGEAATDVERLANALANGGDVRDREVTIARDGAPALKVLLEASPLGEDASRGRVLFLRDVTQRSERESELRRANAELEHCVNALAHDLRSPLVALLGFSRLLRQDYGELLDETGTHFLDRIEQAGRTMEGLIHDLLELSRIGQPGERPALVDPRAVLLQLTAELKPRLEAGNIRLELPETPPPLVYCDRTRLYQVLSNLIGNAIDHMGEPARPRIEVVVTEFEDHHRISVCDNGRGIAPEHHDRIFEVFQSLGPRSDGRRGTGIGLAIVKKIAEKHGGRVWVESAPGVGATFHVSLPRP